MFTVSFDIDDSLNSEYLTVRTLIGRVTYKGEFPFIEGASTSTWQKILEGYIPAPQNRLKRIEIGSYLNDDDQRILEWRAKDIEVATRQALR
jgi:hypothetical protein